MFNYKNMNKLQKISKEPDYQKKATSFSKLIMFAFFISYSYSIFFLGGDSGGWIKPTIFFIVGLFVSSIFIAMPLFLVKRLFPKLSIFITTVSIGITFLLTKYSFLLLLT